MRQTLFLRCSLFVLFLLLLATPAAAQFKANVQGTVTDTSGAIVPEATVTLTNKETNKAQSVTASTDGFYRFSSLPPGQYTLSAEKAGYKKQLLENLTVRAEETQGVDLSLEVGEVTATVTVTDVLQPQLETENANIGKGITTQEVRQLPQVGRDPYELLRLTPGVFGTGGRAGGGGALGLPNSTGPGGSNASIFQVENQPQISANGQRISANNFQIDGVSVNSLQFGGAAVVTPNQESVREIRVKSSTYSAEDGRNSGAQVQTVSQNGTNQFHGSAFLKYNSPKLNAFNKYGTGFGARPERVERLFRQFGGSLGGPIPVPRFGEGPAPAFKLGRNRAFFFFSYEGLRESSSGNAVRFVETPEFRQQVINQRPGSIVSTIFSSPGIAPRVIGFVPTTCAQANFSANCQQVAGGLDIGSLAGARGQYLSLGNLQGGGLDGIPDIQRALISLPRQTRSNQYNLRLDFTPTERDQLAFSTYVTRSDFQASEEEAAGRPGSDIRTTPTNLYGLLTYIRTFSPSTVNEARLSATRFDFNELESATETNFGIPRIEIESLPIQRIKFGADRAETTPGIFAQNTFEFRDVLTHLRGNQALKFGAELRFEQDNNNLLGGARPKFTFGGLFNFANDAPLFYEINADPRTGGPAAAQRYFRTDTYAFFVQDDWKYRPNVTFNLGLRYEYFTPLREKRGQLSNIQFGSNDPINGLRTSRVTVVEGDLFKPDRNNFAPRLGFAWSPQRFEEKLVLRGGFGISYNRLPNVLFSNTRGNPPFFARYAICCGTSTSDFSSPFAGGQILYALGANNSPTSFPVNTALATGIDPATGAPRGSAVEIYGAEPEVPNPYVYAYSFEGQYSLPGNMTAELGYQGSAGHKLIRLVNQNFIYPNNPAFRAVFIPQPDVNSNYNALNARLSRRFSQGFMFDAIYRFSKSTDQLSNEGPGAETNQTYPQDNRTERGPSDFDVRHYFIASGLWDLPIFRNRKDFIGKAFGGFQLGGIVSFNTGFPWTPKTGLACNTTPGGQTLCPARPVGYFGGNLEDTGNEAFMRQGGNFPGGGTKYFDISHPGPPGIGRNTFRGPRYFNVDMTAAKRFGLPSFLGEAAAFEFKANFFNIFNILNLTPFRFGSAGVFIESNDFGRAERGLSGRVIEFQGRFVF
ncbi:MAG TPA: TonB-dependent receptor [Pyrinomonadaceae bacterium]|jgi:hypothetical protein